MGAALKIRNPGSLPSDPMRPNLLPLLLPVLLQAQAPPLGLEDLLRLKRPGLAQARHEVTWRRQAGALAATGPLSREGLQVAVETGPRRGTERTGTDRVVSLEWPLFFAVRKRAEAGRAQAEAQPRLRGALEVEATHQLVQAYLEAWAAQAQLGLRERQLEAVKALRAVAVARVEAGFDPALQVALVEGEVLRLQGEVAEGRRRHWDAWATLRALVDLPQVPGPLAEPGRAGAPGADPAALRAAFERGVLRTALRARRQQEQSQLAFQDALRRSRWSLRASHAEEGIERVSRVGLAFRLPHPGELGAQAQEQRAASALLELEGALAEQALVDRFEATLARLGNLEAVPEAAGFEAAMRALEARLREGKDRPSEVLPLRRALIEAEGARLARIREAAGLQADLEALTTQETR